MIVTPADVRRIVDAALAGYAAGDAPPASRWSSTLDPLVPGRVHMTFEHYGPLPGAVCCACCDRSRWDVPEAPGVCCVG